MLHDMSKEFWLMVGWSVIGCSVLGAVGSIYYRNHQLAMLLGFVGVGAGSYLVQLGRYSKSRAERHRESSGL
jgi:hypothetical protein